MVQLIHLCDHGAVIDSVPVDYDDAFTLDSFLDCCSNYHDAQKAFLIARVSTNDPKQPQKAFYSYYNAYQLNKILFRTQQVGARRMLHRLFVLNPLTNSDIIGEVEYFKVEAPVVAPIASPLHPTAEDCALVTSPVVLGPWVRTHGTADVDDKDVPDASPKVRESKLKVMTRAPTARDMQRGADESVKSPVPRGELTRFGEVVGDDEQLKLEKEAVSPKVMSFQNALAQGTPSFQTWVGTLGKASAQVTIWKAERFATDDDFLRQSDIRAFFRSNSLTPEEAQLYAMPTVDSSATSAPPSPENTPSSPAGETSRSQRRRKRVCLIL